MDFRLIHSGISSYEDIAAIENYECRNITDQEQYLEDYFFGIYVNMHTIAPLQITSFKLSKE